ncbi:MAG: hypothetical protein MGU50_22065, partial [Trichodesmium sp. MAG_R02]|nr:hypothetical protein [Trichodesmium sp. MAG_R02]
HRHNQNLVGTLHATSLLWSTDMKNSVISRVELVMGPISSMVMEVKLSFGRIELLILGEILVH